MQAKAVVVQIDELQAIVRVLREDGGCGRCTEPGGCRSALLDATRMHCNIYTIDNALAAPVGAQVMIEVPAGAPLQAAIRAYVFPLLLVLCGAAAGQILGDGWAAVGGVGALLLAFCVLRKTRQTPSTVMLKPRMLSILAEQ